MGMKIIRVQYTVQADFAEQNQKNIQAVMDELRSIGNADVIYTSYRLPDGNIVILGSAGDPWGGEKIFQLLSGTSAGEGWGFIYEHIKARSDLRVGSSVRRGEVIATKIAPEGFTAHFQLSFLFNNYEFIRDVQCWPD